MNVQLTDSPNIITDESLEAMMRQAGADYTVKTVPTPNPVGNGDTGFYTSFRTDTNKVFQQGLSKSYTPIQNKDALRVLTELSKQTNVSLANLFVMNDGKEIAAQISVGDDFVDGKKRDRVSNYLSIINGHDGSHAMSIYMTPYRWGCENQINSSLSVAKAEGKKTGRKVLMSVQHTRNVNEKLEELIQCVNIAQSEFQNSMDIYRKLEAATVDQDFVEATIKEFFPLDPEVGKRGKTIWKNKMEDVSNRFQSADRGLTRKDSAWNLYNSIQGHIQHYGKQTDSHMKSVLFGQDSNRAADALLTILSWVSSQSVANALTTQQQDILQ